MVYCLTLLVFSMLAHSEHSSTESSGVFCMIFSHFITTLEMSSVFKGLSIIRQEALKTTERLWGYLHTFRDRCTAEAEKGTKN